MYPPSGVVLIRVPSLARSTRRTVCQWPPERKKEFSPYVPVFGLNFVRERYSGTSGPGRRKLIMVPETLTGKEEAHICVVPDVDPVVFVDPCLGCD
jgi:hypothetical protein